MPHPVTHLGRRLWRFPKHGKCGLFEELIHFVSGVCSHSCSLILQEDTVCSWSTLMHDSRMVCFFACSPSSVSLRSPPFALSPFSILSRCSASRAAPALSLSVSATLLLLCLSASLSLSLLYLSRCSVSLASLPLALLRLSRFFISLATLPLTLLSLSRFWVLLVFFRAGGYLL